MSVNKKFELYKLQREIARSGITLVFKREESTYFNEGNGNEVDVCEVKGIYHEQSQFINLYTQENIQSRTRKSPMFLAPLEELKEIKIGDYAYLASGKAHVTGIRDIQGWGLVGDVSFEFFDTGENR